ncbi:MAG: plasma-membrane proton-efflux P-type ATPase [Chloroflexi bacterium]|nr:plasma-membrane proton-efflux P-type ATPase [Chloroflexota bacterium]
MVDFNLETGLSESQVQSRREEYGSNEVPERRNNPLWMFARKFWGLSAWMLELIMLLSWVLRKYSDVYVVGALLLVNAILSFVQEQRASSSVAMLRRRLELEARVLRDSQWLIVPASELVPGDVVRLRSGDFVPADIRVLSGHLAVDQSALTGESLDVEKPTGELLYSGATVRHGEATGGVVATGIHTYFGRAVQLVQIARPRLHVEELISDVVRWLFVVVGLLSGLALGFSIYRGFNLLEILPLLLVVLLSAIPVALPAMFTVTTALGALDLARKGVLVTRLSASEDAATMDVLCVDKTGTITRNELSIYHIVPLSGFSEDEVVLYGALASNEANRDPLDLAFLAAAREKNLLDGSWVQTRFVPFDPLTRRTEAVVEGHGHTFRVVKGAVSAIAEICVLQPMQAAALEEHIYYLAQSGCRSLAVARISEQQTELVGLVSLHDRPRPDSRQLIDSLRKLGVSVKMLTGDAVSTAQQVAESVGLQGSIIRIADLAALLEREPARAADLADKSAGFAEVYPEDKYAIVKSLQEAGHIVGMTGDGINDAPALRQTEVGIAVHSATDVAKSAASVILTAEGLSGIVDLVKNGRQVHQRIRVWIINKISRTILKSTFVVLAFLATGQYVISAFAMLLMVFINDFVKVSLATDTVRWSPQPERWDVPELVKAAALLGALMVVEAFVILSMGLRYFGLQQNTAALHTFSFEILFFFAMFSILVVRERDHFWSSRPSLVLGLAIVADLLVGITLVSLGGLPSLHALPPAQTGFVLVSVAFCSLVVNDLIKVWLTKGGRTN